MDPVRVEALQMQASHSFAQIENAAQLARQAAWASLNPLSYAIQPGGLIIAPYSIASTQYAAYLAESAVRDARDLLARLLHEAAQQREVSNAGSSSRDATGAGSRARIPKVGTAPDAVAAWWAGLSDEEKASLLSTSPELLGGLDGLPAAARVEANRNRVPGLLKQAEAELALLVKEGTDAKDYAARKSFLEHEIAYLRQVQDGKVQLYLYDKENSRIIEMIGTPGPDTTRVLSYVPGTYTGMDSFFTGGVQQVAKYLVENTPGTVAFVYKDGIFPGEKHGQSADPNLFRIGEANDQAFTLEAGKTLAGFEAGMRADPALGNAEQIGIGHSWGLANVVSSEEAGARYDKVISLAGAGMPEGWVPKEGTSYSNFYYYDILIHAQSKGLVWSGNNPVSSSDFDQYYYNDDRIQGKFINSWEEKDALMDNHNRIVRDSKDNRQALRDMKILVSQ